jgi:hypothetical protein
LIKPLTYRMRLPSEWSIYQGCSFRRINISKRSCRNYNFCGRLGSFPK